jgi:hypothetical protein
VSTIWLLLGLLVAAFWGTLGGAQGRTRGYGSPSGVEWLLIGILLGPEALHAFDAGTVRKFQPMAIVGLGWIAMTIGVNYGYVGDRRSSLRGIVTGIGFSLWCAGVVALVIWCLGQRFTALHGTSLSLLAGTLAVVACETARRSMRWLSERYAADGDVSRWLLDVTSAGDAIPLLGLGLIFAASPRYPLTLDLGPFEWFTISCLLGTGLGLVAVTLLARSLAIGESWAVLLGVSLLGIGASTRLGMAAVTTLFCVGLTISAVSHRHTELRALLEPTERPVTLPILLLAGASLDFHVGLSFLGILGLVLAARTSAKLLSGWFLAAMLPAARRAPTAIGFSLVLSGAQTMSVGLLCFFELPKPLGSIALITAATVNLFGEIVGRGSLRRALFQSGELSADKNGTKAS